MSDKNPSNPPNQDANPTNKVDNKPTSQAHRKNTNTKTEGWGTDDLVAALSALNPYWHNHWALADTDIASMIVSDSRKVQAGFGFIALIGDKFDGHHFVQTAKDNGAVFAIVSRPCAGVLPQLVVDDTRLALGALGAYRRKQLPQLKLVAITGSSGKTTTKEMLGSILGQLAPTLITQGNLNNELGVPLTLLNLNASHRFAVLELGANHLGEIAYTANLVAPDVACVLNVGTAHLGEFGGRDCIASAKAEIFGALTAKDTAILPINDDYYSLLKKHACRMTGNTISFGGATAKPITSDKVIVPTNDNAIANKNTTTNAVARDIAISDTAVGDVADVYATDIVVDDKGSTFVLHHRPTDQRQRVQLRLLGQHNVDNALAAASCAIALGVPLAQIATGLQNTTPTQGRMVKTAMGEHWLIDDTYNANPTSVLAAAVVLSGERGQKILVLGDIGELGSQAQDEHFALGLKLATLPIDQFFATGELSYHTIKALTQMGKPAHHFDDQSALVAGLLSYLDRPSTLLFKGSRTAQMEQVIDGLYQQYV